MINATAINSAKEAPPKGKQTKLVPLALRQLNPGYRCAKCENDFPSTAGSKFRWIGRFKRRVCPGCAKETGK